MKIEDFYTAEKASEGVKFNLPSPAGTPTDQWIIIRHVDCDEFRRAKAATMSRRLEMMGEKDPDRRIDLLEELRLEQLASLVGGWSFEKECNKDNVISFLRKAPYVAHIVDARSVEARHFFKPASTDS